MNSAAVIRTVRLVLAFAVAVSFLIPVIWMLFVSVKTEGTPIKTLIDWFLPPYTFINYANVLSKTPMLRWMWNSLFIAVVKTVLTVLFTSLAAFAVSKIRFSYKNAIFLFFIAGLMIPGEATIIPLYAVVKDMDLLDSYMGIILPGIAAPLGVVILKSFFDGVPKEVIESAEMDGCGLFRIYSTIVVPLAKPALASIAIFTFIGSWNNFLWPYLSITSEELFTLPVGIPTLLSNYTVDYVTPMTVNAIASIPVIVTFMIFEKQIVQGISFTGIKG
ncbi:carbohydrate ABC transporter permease [Paenibacillus filicis]|uniref:Carbohydrate ABC transporter permease n=1 Tax=Paenibacillus gyeongsangnamensis TaxID=3388067 RepID=A0ABT4Q412_9BACL|nr:carbohydrate ABC transporter permease [Paenibacillus filicis]MCZ8511599.1 carbohydrate ABC transporter permease [Paenibacillus filicis]